ncbi:hypothetical protein XHC_4020 [Xanthomonas hortorum pv. carotae str. M081]|nr:hypothetical protein XHC_4020 [Xanthomonas hortorum pv. carotae str. M081]
MAILGPCGQAAPPKVGPAANFINALVVGSWMPPTKAVTDGADLAPWRCFSVIGQLPAQCRHSIDRSRFR